MNWFICTTGYSFLDVWTLVHFSFWIFVGSTLWAFKVNQWVALASCMLVSYTWELIEYFAAPKYPSVWKDPESWWNAWISDPLTCLLGVMLIWWLLDHRIRIIS